MDIEMDGRAALQKAIAEAQAEMHNPVFDSENPYFKSKFASLAAVRNAVVPQLAKRGVAVFQDLTAVEGGVACTTILAGFGSEIRFGPLVIPAAKKDAHGYAAAGSYAKRIHLQAVACVVGDDDDDGNTAVGGKPMVHDPLDRASLTVNPAHQAYAVAFINALPKGYQAVRAVEADLKSEEDDNGRKWDEEDYRAVWSLMDSKTRSAIKKALQQEAA